MITSAEHAARRAVLSEAVEGPILLMGNGEQARNLPLTPLPFRQDSTFLYYTGCHMPGAAALLVDGQATLFAEPPADDDALWHGVVETLAEAAERLGFAKARPLSELEDAASGLPGLQTLSVPDRSQTRIASRLTGLDLNYPDRAGSDELVDAVISQRKRRSPAELDEMRAAVEVADAAHRAAMAITRPGAHEREIRAIFDGTVMAHGMAHPYGSIVTVQGEVLHNFRYVNQLEEGQLLLLDGGAETASGYASDITRTWPVSGRFTGRQRAAYEAVLAAQEAAIDLVRPGIRYREVHHAACLVLARFLVEEKLLCCSPEDAVAAGAHAVFFPHGVGHLIGLDVHDLENFGDRACYDPRYSRSDDFGTAWLRIDLDLEPGMVVTVEPGFYVVPAILHDTAIRARFASLVDFEEALTWTGFGGIRIEDDVAVTAGAPEVLSASIPKAATDLEALVGTRESPFR